MGSLSGTAYPKKTNSSFSSHQLPIASYLEVSLAWKGYLRANYLLHISSHKGFFYFFSFRKTTFLTLPPNCSHSATCVCWRFSTLSDNLFEKENLSHCWSSTYFYVLWPDNAGSYQSNTAFLTKTRCHLVPPERIKVPGNNPNILPQEGNRVFR